MRLVHLADYGGPYAGSFVPMLAAVAGAARARGWTCELAFSDYARGRAWIPELEGTGATVRFLPPRRGVAGLVAERPGPAILHTHFTRFDVAAALARARRPDARVFWHLHTRTRDEPAVVARNFVKFAVFGRLVERILCVGPGVAASVRRRGAPGPRVLLFPNGIDTTRFAPCDRDARLAARAALSLPAETPVLLHFGWDWHTKGGDLFLGAVRHLLTRGSGPLVALTVGGGDEARRLASRLGIADAVRVEPPTERVSDLFAAADVFVASSRAEGGWPPYAVAEALASGVPVAATNIPAHVVPGLAIPIARLEPEALAETIRSVLERDPSRTQAEAGAGVRWVAEHFDLVAWAERLFRLYDEALAG